MQLLDRRLTCESKLPDVLDFCNLSAVSLLPRTESRFGETAFVAAARKDKHDFNPNNTSFPQHRPRRYLHQSESRQRLTTAGFGQIRSQGLRCDRCSAPSHSRSLSIDHSQTAFPALPPRLMQSKHCIKQTCRLHLRAQTRPARIPPSTTQLLATTGIETHPHNSQLSLLEHTVSTAQTPARIAVDLLTVQRPAT